jgi:hypothetical protein
MRRAFFLLCVVCSPGVVVAQMGHVSPTVVSSYGSPQFFVGPSYRSAGDNFYVAPRSANVYSATRSSQVGNAFAKNVPTWVNSESPHPHATYFRNPYYPSLSFTPQIDMRPQEYVIPPVTRTPLHDPYFEERDFSDDWDPYQYWGW